MIILGIETSCDETAASIVEKKNDNIRILSNIVSSQVKLHSEWGGVVPNLAAREHLKNIIPVIKNAFKKAKIKPEKTDLIAVTSGPGLIPALLVGTITAKTISYAWKKSLIGIHHIEGHIYANFIGKSQIPNPKSQIFPILCLVVSGGHTQLVFMKKHLNYKIIGETQDDAAGEAFDKVARILGLGYPGGPAIAACAEKKSPTANHKLKTKFPRPMLNSKNFNFSFSGLKTAVLYAVKKNEALSKDQGFVASVCQEFQQAVIDVLVAKTIAAAKKYRPKTIMLAGGVSANKELQKQLKKAVLKDLPSIHLSFPKADYQLDNASMIATAAAFRWERSKNKKQPAQNWRSLQTDSNLKLNSSR